MSAAYASRAASPPPMQGSLPAGGLRLCREGVEPSGSQRKVSGYIHPPFQDFPDASWAHARRKFYDIYAATQSPLAGEALRQIAELYEIEDEIRGQPAEQRRRVRQQRSRPLVEAMQVWLAETLGRISGRSALAQAMRYALNHWNGLILFLDDGRLELDTNTVERAMRPVALGRKNALFAGSDSGGRHWAIIATLIQIGEAERRRSIGLAYRRLERIVSGRTKRHELDTLLPWNWKAAKAAETHDTT